MKITGYRIEIYINGKKTSYQKALETLRAGKEQLDLRIDDAVQQHISDPWMANTWFDGMEIKVID